MGRIYTYVGNDPLNLIDPFGLAAERGGFGGAIGSAVVGTASAFADRVLAGETRDDIFTYLTSEDFAIDMAMTVVGGPLGKVAGTAAKGVAEGLGFTRSQLQHGFRHAKDFGVGGNANNKTLSEFSSALQSHVDAAGTRAIQGTYRGTPVTHHVDPSTGLNVIRDSSGNFLSGWKLSPQQLQHVLTTGRLGGGR